jgi:3-hydroxyisobutyrate dehydrogenase-like beta-hydroxyacid dehydrogenase
MKPTERTLPRIAVLGLGEAGAAIAEDLARAGGDVRGFDPKVDAPPGVEPRDSDADAARDADVVLSVNSARDAMDALVQAMPALRRGTLWADLNTASPGAKADLAETAGRVGVEVADVALMAPVPGRGMHTPMVASGPGARRYAHELATFGLLVEVLDGPAGVAISRKLLRSVFLKGLAAALIEALDGARAAGCEGWLIENVSRELAEFGPAAVERLVAGTHKHARRRADEMDAAAQQLSELGVEPRIALATRDALRAITRR